MKMQVTHTVTQSPTSSTYVGMDASKLDNTPWGYVDLEGIIGECSLNDERSKARRNSRRRSRPTRKLLEERGGSTGGSTGESSGALTASTSTMEDLSSHSPGGHNDETPNDTTSGTPLGRRIVLEASRERSPGAFALLRRNLGSNDISEPMNKIESSSPRRGGKIPQTCRGSGPMVIQASSTEISCDESPGRFRARSPGICRPKMAKSSSERNLGRRPTRSRSPGIFRRRKNEAVEEDTAYDSKTEIGSPSATTPKKPSSLHNLRSPGRFRRALSSRRLQCFEQAN
jgi:hypothetical protein